MRSTVLPALLLLVVLLACAGFSVEAQSSCPLGSLASPQGMGATRGNCSLSGSLPSGSQCQFNCSSGFTYGGGGIAMCQGSGFVPQGGPLVCLGDCPLPPPGGSTSWPPPGFSLGKCEGWTRLKGNLDSCNMSVAQGYVLLDPATSPALTLVCNDTRLSPLPAVHEMPCAGSQLAERVGALTDWGSCPRPGRFLPSRASCAFNCSAGATATQSGYTSCAFGSWGNTIQPQCRLSCARKFVAGVAENSCTAEIIHANSCTMQGSAGWRLVEGSLTLTCNNGTFTAPPPLLIQDVKDQCNSWDLLSPPAPFTRGSCPERSASLSMATGYSCSWGCNATQVLLSAGKVDCTPGTPGIWSATNPSCQPKCIISSRLPAGVLKGDCGDFLPQGASCSVAEAFGWALVPGGSLTITCNASTEVAAWPPIKRVCDSKVGQPFNGGVGGPCTGPFFQGTNCPLLCAAGWTGPAGTIQCQANTASPYWTLTQSSSCTQDFCVVAEYQSFIASWPDVSLGSCNMDRSSGSCNVACPYQWVSSGSSSLYCINGAVSNGGSTPLQCNPAPNKCSDTLPAGGAWAGGCMIPLSYGAQCQIVAQQGWAYVSGNPMRYCGWDGKFPDPLPQFGPAPCPTIGSAESNVYPLPANVARLCAAGHVSSGGSCKLSCAGNFVPLASTPSVATCSFGSWTVSSWPVCLAPCQAPIGPRAGAGNCTDPIQLLGNGTSCTQQASAGYRYIGGGPETRTCFNGSISLPPVYAGYSAGSPCNDYTPLYCRDELSCLSGTCRAVNVTEGNLCVESAQCIEGLSCIGGRCTVPSSTAAIVASSSAQAQGVSSTGAASQAPSSTAAGPATMTDVGPAASADASSSSGPASSSSAAAKSSSSTGAALPVSSTAAVTSAASSSTGRGSSTAAAAPSSTASTASSTAGVIASSTGAGVMSSSAGMADSSSAAATISSSTGAVASSTVATVSSTASMAAAVSSTAQAPIPVSSTAAVEPVLSSTASNPVPESSTAASGDGIASNTDAGALKFVITPSSTASAPDPRVYLQPLVVQIASPPSSVPAGDQLQLVASVSMIAPTERVSFEWTCSDASLSLWDPAVTEGGVANSSVLTIRNGVLLADTSVTFTVRVRDDNPLHVLADRPESRVGGEASATVAITRAAALAISVGDLVVGRDPCDDASPCLNGGACSSSRVGGNILFRCACPSTPVAFFGPTCSLALVSCANCTSSFTGGRRMSLFVLGAHALRAVKLAGQPVWSSAQGGMEKVNASVENVGMDAYRTLVSLGATGLYQVSFRAPAIHVNESYSLSSAGRELSSVMEPLSFAAGSGTPKRIPPSYEQLSLISVLPGSSDVLVTNLTRLVFYTASLCVSPGQWRDDPSSGGCLSCPASCSLCSGGGRCTPAPGYWSASEMQAPVECQFPEKCQGASGTCSVGYEGVMCEYCAPGWFQQNQACYPCGSSTDQRSQIILALISAAAVMALLATAVAFLRAMALATTVTMFCVLQQLAMAGIDGVKNSPYYRRELSTFFTWLNLINFEIEILRPGCAGVPTFSYVRKFQVTLLLMLFAAMMFFVACCVRLLVHVLRGDQQSNNEVRVQSIKPTSVVPVAGGRGGRKEWPAVMKKGGKHQQEAEESKNTTETSVSSEADSHRSDRSDSSSAVSPSPAAGRLRAAARGSILSRVMLARASSSGAWTDFKERAEHATLILLCIFYLRLSILEFKALRCSMLPDPVATNSIMEETTFSLYLAEDGSTLCYKPDHLWVLSFVALLMVCYTLAFPLYCFVLLTRAFADASTTGIPGWCFRRVAFLRQGQHSHIGKMGASAEGQEGDQKWAAVAKSKSRAAEEELQRHREARYGYLFMGYQPRHFAASLQVFFVHAWFAWVSVYLPARPLLQLFLFGLVSSLQAMFIAFYLPFSKWNDNATKLLVALGQLGHTTLMLGVQRGGTSSPLFLVMASLAAVVLVLLVVRRQIKLPCGRVGAGQTKAPDPYAPSTAENEVEQLTPTELVEENKPGAVRRSSDSHAKEDAVVELVPSHEVGSEEIPSSRSSSLRKAPPPKPKPAVPRPVHVHFEHDDDDSLPLGSPSRKVASSPSFANIARVAPIVQRSAHKMSLHSAAAAAVEAIASSPAASSEPIPTPQMFSAFIARPPTLAAAATGTQRPAANNPASPGITPASPEASFSAASKALPAAAPRAKAATPSLSAFLSSNSSIVLPFSSNSSSGGGGGVSSTEKRVLPSVVASARSSPGRLAAAAVAAVEAASHPTLSNQSKRMVRQGAVLKHLTNLSHARGAIESPGGAASPTLSGASSSPTSVSAAGRPASGSVSESTGSVGTAGRVMASLARSGLMGSPRRDAVRGDADVPTSALL